MESQGTTYIRHVPELAPLLEHADHIDVKTVTGSVEMRTFLAGMLSDRPAWVTLLYSIRGVFVRLLGLRQNGIPPPQLIQPEDIPMQIGENILFFKLLQVKDDHYWIVKAEDKHLAALLGVVIEPVPDKSQRRFHVLTIVYYRNWAGPVYFQIIRPFHHLVVASMARAGIRPTRQQHITM